MYACV